MIREAHAIYKKGRLIFLDKTVLPKDGTEVTITFKDDTDDKISFEDAIKALNGCAKGEGLLEKLLEMRKEDREKDEENYRRLIS
jgi:hypothetical protein